MTIKLFASVFVAVTLLSVIACNGNSTPQNEKENKVEIKDSIPPQDTFSFKGFNSVAYILAGKEPSDKSFFSNIVNSNEFKSHQSMMNQKWNTHQKSIDIIREWSKINIGVTDTVFYPFAGPDFNYLAAFFPDCRFSMLIGLEKGGKIPFSDSLSIKNYAEILKMLTSSVSTNLESSFFCTNNMKNDLAGYIEGTLPLIMMFMSRYDFEILNINPIFINNQGEFEYFQKDKIYDHTLVKDFEDSYEIIYTKEGDDFDRKMYYFSMDISDEAIDKQKFELLMENYFNGKTTFLKAASYLLDRSQFIYMKELILKYSDRVITGPSGMQYRFFDKAWDIKLFGNYTGPINLFSERRQDDLKKAYIDGNPSPIKFKFDYNQTSHSLIIAQKK